MLTSCGDRIHDARTGGVVDALKEVGGDMGEIFRLGPDIDGRLRELGELLIGELVWCGLGLCHPGRRNPIG